MTRRTTATNHDPPEIARFDAIAQRWWDPHGEFRPLHALNPVRLDYVDSRAGLAGKRVLDVGCGGGLLSEAMARRGAQVTGIDLAPQTIEVAELHALESKRAGAATLRESAETHAAAIAGAYDIVTCMEMLEHVPEPDSVLARAAHAGEARRSRVRLDAQPQSQVVPAGDRRRRVRAESARARHAHLRAIHQAVGAGPLGARGAARPSRTSPGSPTIRCRTSARQTGERRRELHDASAASCRRRGGSQ